MAVAGNCSADACQAPTGGACLEGFSALEECPNFSLAPAETAEPASRAGAVLLTDQASETGENIHEEDQHVILPSGNALTASKAHHLTSEIPTTVVILVGMADSGKTTLLAEIYEKYRQGPFVNHLFAGTQTIMGFERVCHYARAASRGTKEVTSRTIKGIEDNLLHLDLVDRKSRLRKRLLVSDLSGEHFEDATETNDQLRAIPYLRRADHFVLFADAGTLRDLAKRQSLLSQMLVLLRGCAEESLVDRACRLTVVLSRHDLFPNDETDNENEAFIELLQKKLTVRANALVNDAPTFFKLAARPDASGSAPYGMEEVLSVWLAIPGRPDPCLPRIDPNLRNHLRQIDSMTFKGSGDG